MSRIGRAPIEVPSGVDVKIDGNRISIKGPRGELSRVIPESMKVEQEDGKLVVNRPSDANHHRSLHGLTRTLVANMVEGVTRGFEKTIEIYGVGYRAAKQGNRLALAVGYSHPVEITPPDGIEIATIETFSPTQANEYLTSRFTVRGIDKEHVGQFAADIRAVREPEPYKGKGLRYRGERIRRKAGKTAGKGKGGK
jgi:large subunit ribosomal protein L6